MVSRVYANSKAFAPEPRSAPWLNSRRKLYWITSSGCVLSAKARLNAASCELGDSTDLCFRRRRKEIQVFELKIEAEKLRFHHGYREEPFPQFSWKTPTDERQTQSNFLQRFNGGCQVVSFLTIDGVSKIHNQPQVITCFGSQFRNEFPSTIQSRVTFGTHSLLTFLLW